MSITAPSERMTPTRHRELVDAIARTVPAHLPVGICLPDTLAPGQAASAR